MKRRAIRQAMASVLENIAKQEVGGSAVILLLRACFVTHLICATSTPKSGVFIGLL